MKGMKYKNVTISGLPGAGSSTLGKLLAQKIGWDYFSGGDFMRAYAIEHGLFDGKNVSHHDATVYSDEFDRKVDYGMREKLESGKGRIFDSWLSGFVAQGVDNVLKVLVTCSDDAVRVDRIANRDRIAIPVAKKHIFEREQKNLKKWQRMYNKEWKKWVVDRGVVGASEEIYFWRPELYDLVIDTFHYGRDEVLEIVLKELEDVTSNTPQDVI